MKHISEFDGKEYEISRSVSVLDGRVYDDDITLIWYDKQYDDDMCYDEEPDARALIGWYWGDYDEELTEAYIEDYWRDK